MGVTNPRFLSVFPFFFFLALAVAWPLEATDWTEGSRLSSLVRAGSRSLPYVALTIDDGPHPEYVPRLLKIFEQEGIKATFFVVGKMAKKYPECIRLEVEAGHEVGNHTYRHLPMTSLMKEEIIEELEKVNEVVSPITGRPMNLFRPPGGRYDRRVVEIAAEQGYRTVLWSVASHDYGCADPQAIAKRILKGVRPGSIILCHSGLEPTLSVLPEVIRSLKQRGYVFVTVSELLQIQIAQAR